jgi:mono/diheme cytochrome c family protein
MKLAIIIIGVIAAVGGALAVSLLMFIGPRMYDQRNIPAYAAKMPLAPEGTVPVSPTAPQTPKLADIPAVNPVAMTAEDVARGKTYYEYYCAFCHGDDGSGTGPVGQSYVPTPSDLRAEKIRKYSDRQLHYSMLNGIHAPVMGYTVLPEHRWHIVTYVRSLEGQRTSEQAQPQR